MYSIWTSYNYPSIYPIYTVLLIPEEYIQGIHPEYYRVLPGIYRGYTRIVTGNTSRRYRARDPIVLYAIPGV